MTTITYRNGIMASDSCCSSSQIQVSSNSKVHRTSAGALIGQAGDADLRAVFALLDKVKTSKGLPSRQEIAACISDFELIIAFNPKDVWVVGCGREGGGYNGFCYQVVAPFVATGSGWELAMAAMDCGRSAREAIGVACKYDRRSKLPIHSIGFEKKPPRRKQRAK